MSPSSIILDSGPPNYRPCFVHINPTLQNLIIEGHYKYTFLQILNIFLLIMKVDTKLSISIKNIILYIFGVLERNRDQSEASIDPKK